MDNAEILEKIKKVLVYVVTNPKILIYLGLTVAALGVMINFVGYKKNVDDNISNI